MDMDMDMGMGMGMGMGGSRIKPTIRSVAAIRSPDQYQNHSTLRYSLSSAPAT